LLIVLLQNNYLLILAVKNFENWLIFDEVKAYR